MSVSSVSSVSQPLVNEWILLKYTFVRRANIKSITRYGLEGRRVLRSGTYSIYFGVKMRNDPERIDVYPDDPGYDTINAMITPAWDEYLVQWRIQENESVNEQNRRNNRLEATNNTSMGATGRAPPDDSSTDSE